jgi:hypothetical protein
MGSRGASYVSGTAEDQPPSPSAWLGSSRTNSTQYNGQPEPAQLLRRQLHDSPVVYSLDCASAPAKTRRSGKNSSHSAPGGAGTADR